jgi:uncharacterized protein (UPF0333 family)
MKNFNKKGQAAMEFLMTYGWAILAAVIVIGALGSYFYFNQGGSVNVFAAAPFYAVAAQLNVNEIQLELENKGGEDLRSVVVNVTGNGCTAEAAADYDAGVGPIISVLTCVTPSKSNVQGDIIITYLRPNSALELIATGSISGQVA